MSIFGPSRFAADGAAEGGFAVPHLVVTKAEKPDMQRGDDPKPAVDT
jgi:hypothetical protein